MAGEGPLYIDSIVVTRNAVAIQAPEPPMSAGNPIGKSLPLGVWTRLRGDAEGIKRLKRGTFKLFHVWKQVCGELSNIAEEEPPFDVNGKKSWPSVAKDLDKEVKARGWFDWRTVSRPDYLVGCSYEITVTDELGEPMPCGSLPDGCHVKFEVGANP